MFLVQEREGEKEKKVTETSKTKPGLKELLLMVFSFGSV